MLFYLRPDRSAVRQRKGSVLEPQYRLRLLHYGLPLTCPRRVQFHRLLGLGLLLFTPFVSVLEGQRELAYDLSRERSEPSHPHGVDGVHVLLRVQNVENTSYVARAKL